MDFETYVASEYRLRRGARYVRLKCKSEKLFFFTLAGPHMCMLHASCVALWILCKSGELLFKTGRIYACRHAGLVQNASLKQAGPRMHAMHAWRFDFCAKVQNAHLKQAGPCMPAWRFGFCGSGCVHARKKKIEREGRCCGGEAEYEALGVGRRTPSKRRRLEVRLLNSPILEHLWVIDRLSLQQCYELVCPVCLTSEILQNI